MPDKDVHNIRSTIKSKKLQDKKKLKRLAQVALVCTLARLLLYLWPVKLGGLLVEMLWIPLILLLFALPFYGFEKLLDVIKKS